jgi:hypothetical protein
MNPMNVMRPVKRRLLTLGLVAPLALLAALAPLAMAAPAPLGAGPRALAFEDPDQCPAAAGYARVSVERDPATWRSADRNGDGVVCVRAPTVSVGTVLLIETIGDPNLVGDPTICPTPFSLRTPERLPDRALVGDFRLVDANGDGFACLSQTAGRDDVVVLDNTVGNPHI